MAAGGNKMFSTERVGFITLCIVLGVIAVLAFVRGCSNNKQTPMQPNSALIDSLNSSADTVSVDSLKKAKKQKKQKSKKERPQRRHRSHRDEVVG